MVSAKGSERPGAAPGGTAAQVATFFVDGLCFGVAVLRVQEVIRYQAMTRVPKSPAVVEGLINLRGQIVTAVEMRRRLAMAPRAPESLPMNVVVRTDESVVSLLVDEIGDVLEVGGDRYEPPPETLQGPVRELVTGVYKLRDRLLLVLDVDRTVSLDESQSSAA